MAAPAAATATIAAAEAAAVPAADAGSPAAFPAVSVASLYVGDLAASMDEPLLIEFFSVGKMTSLSHYFMILEIE